MSEDERKQRLNYRVIRKKRITVQIVFVAITLSIALAFSILSMVFDKTYYVDYTEKSSVDYGVHLKDNDFYEESFLGEEYSYIAALIDTVEANFQYEMAVQSDKKIDFEYTYRVDAVIQIKDKFTSKVLYAPVFNELKEVSDTAVGNKISINQVVFVDYEKYNTIVNSFINKYGLQYADASVSLRMIVDVEGESRVFYNNVSTTSQVVSVNIPLSTDTVDIKITSATADNAQKILSHTTKPVAIVFRLIATPFAFLAALLALILWIYAYRSRNIDITYDIKVAKLMRNYKSFIQKIRNGFDTTAYQVLVVDTFDEMLEIRDTIQSPILMEENEDRTCSKFFIPTTNNLLYLFEIRVDDYDQIYSSQTEVSDEPICDAQENGEVCEAVDTAEESQTIETEDVATDGEISQEVTEVQEDQTSEESEQENPENSEPTDENREASVEPIV